MENNRASFGSNFGFLMAAIGSAVGLGNIWGFPYKMGMSGGFAFLLVYLVLAVLVGLAVMIGELTIGRKTGLSPVAAYRKLSKKFTWMGYMAVLVPFLVLCFYFVLGGMVMRYALGYLTAIFGWNTWNVADISEFFGTFILNGGQMILWTAIFIALNAFIVAAGVAEGIEKFCKIGMPALFIMLLIVIVYVAVQPGAMDGYKFMFGWNVEPLKEDFLKVLKTAAGQMFFSLSLGMGAMITYGSYLDKKENLQKNAILIIVMDTLVALMAGLCVLPGRFALDPSGAVGGPSLLFVTMQNVFSRMGGLGPIFGILFYLLVVFAAISSSISLLEVIVAHFVDKARDEGKGDKRKSYTLIAAACVGLGCILVCADRLGASSFSPAELLNIANPKTWAADWLDFWDALSEGVMMPLGALLMSLMIGWEIGPEFVKEEAEQSGHAMGSYGFFKVCVKFITPLIMVLILYGQIKEFFL